MLGRASDASVAQLSYALDTAGIATREIRLREPGLDSLFVQLSRSPDLETAE
jgi:ABC-2 type transport system ATP-binding protein